MAKKGSSTTKSEEKSTNEKQGKHEWVLLEENVSDKDDQRQSTKAMPLPDGTLVKTTTEHKNTSGNVVACSESLTYIPGLKISHLQ